MKKVVIVGAGYAGILTAKKIAKKFKKNDEVNITIIDKNPYHAMLTELHEVAANRVDEDSIRVSLKKVFAGRKVDVKLDTVTSFDFDNKLVFGKAETYEYDYLVLSAGSKPTFFGIPGAEEHAFKLWSYDDAIVIRHNLINLFRKACRIADPEERKKVLSIYIVGAGFTGVEMAGELAEYLPIICEKFEIDRNDVNITIVDVLERTITLLPEDLSRKVEKRLKKMGVNMMFGTYVIGVGEDYIETQKDDMVTRHQASMVIWGAGIESADITGEAAKVLESARRGRIKVDQYLRSLQYEDVFVIGDNMLFIPEGEEDPVPQIVENAEHSAATASHNIISLITGKGELAEYKPAFHGFMVSIGGRYGVARVGLPNLMFNLPSFLAMFAKHMINMLYFVKILGWNKVWSYLRHEFFTIRHCRSFVGGHFSNRTPSFLLVPLRVWLGAVWVYEGIMKYVKGWAAEPILADSIKDTNAWYDSVLSSGANGADGVVAATDAVTGATGEVGNVVEAVGTTIINWDFFGLFKAILVSGNDLANSTIGDFAFKLDIPLLNWFMDSFFLSSDSMQIFMQTLMFLAEIIIGLLLIAGLFTFPAAGASLALQLMFISTTGQYLNTFWMIFAAIAVLIAGGRVFGLDYYVMPALKNWWKGLPLVRRLYIYND
ncbi:MAG: NAD(P)/FAD-dependent oxidoreductase [Clostridiales bacterium]|jgi:NADH dehydrogenase|nr:NAD(P)/FAD-dependent oxidoreductase [Clostridiales bacterium]